MLGESGSSRSAVSSLKAQNECLKSDIKKLHAKIQAGDCRYSVRKTSLSQFLYASNCLLPTGVIAKLGTDEETELQVKAKIIVLEKG